MLQKDRIIFVIHDMKSIFFTELIYQVSVSVSSIKIGIMRCNKYMELDIILVTSLDKAVKHLHLIAVNIPGYNFFGFNFLFPYSG